MLLGFVDGSWSFEVRDWRLGGGRLGMGLEVWG